MGFDRSETRMLISKKELSLNAIFTNLFIMDTITQFFDDCRTGNLTGLKQLIEDDPSLVQARDTKGFTPLIIAVYNHQPEIAQYLIEKGADVNAQDTAGNTALMGAAFKGYVNLAQMLIDAGADVNLRNGNGAPALTFAATFGQQQIAQVLLNKGALINLPDARGKTSYDHAVLQENEAMIALMKKYGQAK